MRSTHRLLRWGAAGLAAAALTVGGAALWLHHRVAASLPVVDGVLEVAGPAGPVTIERDAQGVPTIRARSRSDAAFATGFLHAQERFFQMDLQRRRAAGELAELFGAAALPADRAVRPHRFRALAERALARAAAADRELVAAYTAGVNAGLTALGAPPPEYVLLRVAPASWRREDTLLTLLAMYLVLQEDAGATESALGVMHDTLPEGLFEFLAPPGTSWDAPVDGSALATPPLPGSGVVDLRRRPPSTVARAALPEEGGLRAAGSNAWAVAGARTASGAALLANDPHLSLTVPNIWYRAVLEWTDAGGTPHRLVGVTLPGVPPLVIGSNGRIAWGFTNAPGDWSDLVVLDTDPADPERYRTPGGFRRLEHFRETILVRHGDDVTLDVPWTIWGPVVDRDHRGRPRAYRWVVDDPGSVSLAVAGLETAGSVREALELAHRGGLPAQNLICADAGGHVGWTVAGLVPRRVGFDGRLPSSWADGAHRWDGWRSPDEVPEIVDPPGGRIWNANAREVGGAALRVLGDGGYDLGARAGRIRDGLLALERAHARDMLAIQLDDRAVFLERWRGVLLAALSPAAVAASPLRAELRRLVETSWDGRASVDSVGYRLVREFRRELARQVLGALTAPCRAADPGFDLFRATSQWEGPLWRLIAERPANLLDARFESWDDQILAAADAVIAVLTTGGGRLDGRTWGERNTARIRHPLSRAVPLLARWLDRPALELPGDDDMPRVQAPAFGASMRIVVSPGHEEDGLFEMPGGESGHPLSPCYGDGFDAWARGEATPLLPGPSIHTLVVRPPGGA